MEKEKYKEECYENLKNNLKNIDEIIYNDFANFIKSAKEE